MIPPLCVGLLWVDKRGRFKTLSLLLFALLATSLLFLAFGASDDGGLHELSNHALLVLFILSSHGPPHLLDFPFTSILGFFLHATLLLHCLFFEVPFGELLVFLAHLLAFFPLYQSFSIILGLVAPQIVLNETSLSKKQIKRVS